MESGRDANSGSVEANVDSTCFQSSKLTRISSQLSGLDHSSVKDNFPSYSGNVSLLRTPEYSILSSASGKTSPFFHRIILENQKKIDEMQQQIRSLTEQVRIARQSSVPPTMNGSSCISNGGFTGSHSNAMNLSSDYLIRQRPTSETLKDIRYGVPQKLNFIQNMSQSSPRLGRGIPTMDNNSSTNNSLSNLNKLIPSEKDFSCESHPMQLHHPDGNMSRNIIQGESLSIEKNMEEKKKTFIPPKANPEEDFIEDIGASYPTEPHIQHQPESGAIRKVEIRSSTQLDKNETFSKIPIEKKDELPSYPQSKAGCILQKGQKSDIRENSTQLKHPSQVSKIIHGPLQMPTCPKIEFSTKSKEPSAGKEKKYVNPKGIVRHSHTIYIGQGQKR